MKRLFLTLAILAFSVGAQANGFEITKEKVQTAKVYFATGSATLNTSAKNTLNGLKVYPESELVVVGKTDKRGDEDYNMDLGLRRAQAVDGFFNLAKSSVSSVGEAEAKETDVKRMYLDRVADIKIITPFIVRRPLFGDAEMQLQGPASHIQYKTVPLGQGSKRTTQPRM